MYKTRLEKIKLLLEKVYNSSKSKFGVDYIIMCEGDISSNVLIIAEAPGRVEEEQKRILVGRSGKMVRTMLKNIDIGEKCMFLNVIPWRPENNRTPIMSEITYYSTFWIELINNCLEIDLIISVGSIARKMVEIIRPNIKDNICFKTTIHPAKYMRDKNEIQVAEMYSVFIYAKSILKTNYQSYLVFRM